LKELVQFQHGELFKAVVGVKIKMSMSEPKQTIFKEALAWSSGALISESLPKVGISKIIIKHNTGTAGGGSYVANTAIENIEILIDGKPMINYGGRKSIAGQISMGIAVLRELYKQMHNAVAMPNELFIIELPDALPKGREIQIKAEMATMASMGITTSYDGTYDVLFETRDLVPKATVVPYIAYQEFSDGATTGNLIHYLNALPYKLRTLIMITYDGTTLADTTYDKLELGKPKDAPYFNGKLALLKEKFQSVSGVSLATGFYIASWKNGIVVPSDTLKMNWYAGTAGTAKYIHCAWLAY
jgi:hypothetical protein